jgi:hypothetical protein
MPEYLALLASCCITAFMKFTAVLLRFGCAMSRVFVAHRENKGRHGPPGGGRGRSSLGEGSAEAEEPSKKGVGQDAREGASEGILEEEHVTLN